MQTFHSVSFIHHFLCVVLVLLTSASCTRLLSAVKWLLDVLGLQGVSTNGICADIEIICHPRQVCKLLTRLPGSGSASHSVLVYSNPFPSSLYLRTQYAMRRCYLVVVSHTQVLAGARGTEKSGCSVQTAGAAGSHRLQNPRPLICLSWHHSHCRVTVRAYPTCRTTGAGSSCLQVAAIATISIGVLVIKNCSRPSCFHLVQEGQRGGTGSWMWLALGCPSLAASLQSGDEQEKEGTAGYGLACGWPGGCLPSLGRCSPWEGRLRLLVTPCASGEQLQIRIGTKALASDKGRWHAAFL